MVYILLSRHIKEGITRNKEIIKIVHDFFIEHNVDAHEIEVGN